MYTLSSYLLLVLGGVIFAWALLIVFSDQFFIWWQDRYWKEKNDNHLSFRSTIYNRYGAGFGILALGVAIIWTALSF